VIYNLKQQLSNCQIYQNDNQTYDVRELSENYYGKMILSYIEKSSKTPLQSNLPIKNTISSEDFNNLLESYKMLKVDAPKIIRVEAKS